MNHTAVTVIRSIVLVYFDAASLGYKRNSHHHLVRDLW